MSIRWPYLYRWAWRLLPLVFVPLATADVFASLAGEWLGTDAHLYYRATEAWLSGANPWDVFVTHQGQDFHFVALPPAVVVLAPVTLLPEPVFVPLWIAVQALAGVYVVRRLGLAWWWLAFPPLVKGVLAGNPSPLILALLLSSSAMIQALAPILKVYAGLPMLGDRRWRGIGLATLGGLATVVIAPRLWVLFLTDPGSRTDRLLEEATGGYSAYGQPILMVLAVLALVAIARRDLRAAAWLTPIALWPGSQFHWSTLAMPVISLPLAFGLALPAHLFPAVAVIGHAIWLEVRAVVAARGGQQQLPSPRRSRSHAKPDS